MSCVGLILDVTSLQRTVVLPIRIQLTLRRQQMLLIRTLTDAWNNDPNVLFFNCQSCKAGLLQNLKTDWKKVVVVNIIIVIFLVIVYSTGCCAFRNNRRNNSWKRYRVHNDSVLLACR